MGDSGNVRREGRLIFTSNTDSWTEVRASNRSTNTENLEWLGVYDRSVVSLGRRIGEGGQGCIYEAKLYLPFSFTPLPVAVKKFKPLVGVSQGHFPREIFSTKCYNLCRPFAVFFEGESLCMIMQRYSCDLRAEIDSRLQDLRDENPCYDGPCFPEEISSYVLLELAKGLNALHECGVYHGDLKAANILVMRGENHVDTGFSQLGIADFERSDDVVGTGFYRAPEIFQSLITRIPLSKEQWLATDIYSFGMVCYEVLTGEIPFQSHRLSDHGLVLNGGRPELPDHVPESLKDMIRSCWRADPSSRPSWADIIQHLTSLVHFSDNLLSYVDNMVSLESSEGVSFDSIILKLKQLVRDRQMDLHHDDDAKSFVGCLYWASEFVSTVEEYVYKFEVESLPENPPLCEVPEFIERHKLSQLLVLQHLGYGITSLACTLREKWLELSPEILDQIVQMNILMLNVLQTVCLAHNRVICAKEFDDEVSVTSKLLVFHDMVKWHLRAILENERILKSIMQLFPLFVSPQVGVQNVFIFVCLIVIILVDTYAYAMAIFTYEPIMLCVQYGLYKIKGRDNILYRSSGYRICRLQRVWMNCTGDKSLSIALTSSLIALCATYGWIGFLGWIWVPCVLIFSPVWRRSIIIQQS